MIGRGCVIFGVRLSVTGVVVLLLSLMLALMLAPASAEVHVEPHKRGSLMIVGGGDTPYTIQKKFVELAGGPGRAKIAIFPMAKTEFDEELDEVLSDFAWRRSCRAQPRPKRSAVQSNGCHFVEVYGILVFRGRSKSAGSLFTRNKGIAYDRISL